MSTQEDSIEETARTFARTAAEGFRASAAYFRSLPDDAWHSPTGCAEWDMRFLAEHIAGEAVWFPNLVRGATRGEAPYSGEVYEQLKSLSAHQLADRTDDAAGQVRKAVEEATPDQLQELVDLGFARMPVWQATYISLMEGSYHNWDTRAKRESRATIPTSWALQLCTRMIETAPILAHQDGVDAAPGTYLMLVANGVGPVTVTARDGQLSVEPGALGDPDVTIHLDADEYVRLIAGRLDLSTEENSGIPIEGDRETALRLNRIFGGIANG